MAWDSVADRRRFHVSRACEGHNRDRQLLNGYWGEKVAEVKVEVEVEIEVEVEVEVEVEAEVIYRAK
jgi:hypothetical protein